MVTTVSLSYAIFYILKKAGHDGARFFVFGWLRKDHYFKVQPGQFRETISEKKEL